MAELDDFDVTDDNNTGRWPENMQFSAVNDAGRADEGIIARWWQDNNGSLTASGSSNAFTVASNRTIAALYDDLTLCFTANHSITGACTLNLNGLGAKSIKSANGNNLGSGMIVSGQAVKVVYKSTPDAWLLMSVPASLSGAASDSVAGVIEIATAAETKTGTDATRAVVPGRQHYHPSAAKAWGIVTVSGGTPTLQKSRNVSGITDTATGRLTVTLDNDFDSANYAIAVSVEFSAAGAVNPRIATVSSGTRAAGSFEVNCKAFDGSLSDPAAWHFACFGELA